MKLVEVDGQEGPVPVFWSDLSVCSQFAKGLTPNRIMFGKVGVSLKVTALNSRMLIKHSQGPQNVLNINFICCISKVKDAKDFQSANNILFY